MLLCYTIRNFYRIYINENIKTCFYKIDLEISRSFLFNFKKSVNTIEEVMKMDRKEYDQLAEELKPTGHKVKNGFNAFLYGGVMGVIAQAILEFFMNVYHCSQKEATPMMTITLVFFACLLTGLGIYDNIAKHAGAGTFIPITGFANSMSSSAMDSRSEGLIFGIGSNMFKLGGTVITYGIVSSSLLGVIRYVITLFW
jgi:stage V sporulation protein AC